MKVVERTGTPSPVGAARWKCGCVAMKRLFLIVDFQDLAKGLLIRLYVFLGIHLLSVL